MAAVALRREARAEGGRLVSLVAGALAVLKRHRVCLCASGTYARASWADGWRYHSLIRVPPRLASGYVA